MMGRGQSFAERYGPWALVAGASEGIGADFARRIAAAGVNVVLLARRAEPLEALAAEIRGRSGVEVRTGRVDLTSPTLLEDLAPVLAPPTASSTSDSSSTTPARSTRQVLRRPPGGGRAAARRPQLPRSGAPRPPVRPSDGRARPRRHHPRDLDVGRVWRCVHRHLQRDEGVRPRSSPSRSGSSSASAASTSSPPWPASPTHRRCAALGRGDRRLADAADGSGRRSRRRRSRRSGGRPGPHRGRGEPRGRCHVLADRRVPTSSPG